VRKLGSTFLLLVLVTTFAMSGVANGSASDPCGSLSVTTTCGTHAEGAVGDFHGLIAVRGAPWVLNVAGRSGSTPGCGDCTWSIVLACSFDSPSDPGTPLGCTPARGSAGCPGRQLLYRLYLSTDAAPDTLEGTLCLGGRVQPVPIGDHAAGDVQRYLKDVVPPNLDVTTKPKVATLAGLTTYFAAETPSTLRPAPFGGGDITETITLAPSRADWSWGDGAGSGWAPAATNVTHSYARGGTARVDLTTRWGATYTITYQGRTFGPYDAVGQLTKQQTLTLPVRTSSPTLVSH
jgi:hypothetical protein